MSKVLIVVIGSDWPIATSRVFNLEVAAALTGNIPVIPVLVGGATTPRAEDLPDPLKLLTGRRVHELSHTRWDDDVKHLIARLKESLSVLDRAPAASGDVGLDKATGAFEKVFEEAEERRRVASATPRGRAAGLGSLGPSEPLPVLLAASAPTTAPPGDQFVARFAAYLKAVEQEVKEHLAGLSPRATPHMGMATCRWRSGTAVMVRLAGTHLQVNPREDSFVWEGDRQFVSFAVTVAPDAPMGGTVLKFESIIEGVVVARLLLDLEIAPETVAAERRFATVEPARTAFASYASPDRDEVLGRVASLTNAAGLQVFLDSASLRAGKRWQEQLATAIKDHELFLLFWSTSASRSKWVKWEWQTALREKGLDAIQPHPLEPVTRAPPPRELDALHFGDAYVLIREAYRNARPS